MKFMDIRAELENVGPVKKLDIVNLIIYNGEHYCTEIHYWPNIQSMTITYYSEQAYIERYISPYTEQYLINTIFHLPVEPADIIEADQVNAPF